MSTRIEKKDGKIFYLGAELPLGTEITSGRGSVKFVRAEDGGIEVVRYSRSGAEKFTHPLTADGTWHIGPKDARRYDPLERMLRKAGAEDDLVFRHSPGSPYVIEGVKANLWCNVRCRASEFVVSDETTMSVVWGRVRKVGGNYTEQNWTASLTSPKWAVVAGWWAAPNARVETRIFAVHIWGIPDKDSLAAIEKVVVDHLHGAEATLEMVVSFRAGRVEPWIQSRILPGSDSWQVRLGAEEFSLHNMCGEIMLEIRHDCRHAYAWRFNRFDRQRRLEMLPSKQREFADALLDETKALPWLLANGRFFRESDQLLIADAKGRLFSVEKNHYTADGILALLNRRPKCFDALLDSAPQLGNAIPVEHIDLYPSESFLNSHLAAAGFSSDWKYDGAAQAGEIRFITARAPGHIEGADELRSCKAESSSSMEVCPTDVSDKVRVAHRKRKRKPPRVSFALWPAIQWWFSPRNLGPSVNSKGQR